MTIRRRCSIMMMTFYVNSAPSAKALTSAAVLRQPGPADAAAAAAAAGFSTHRGFIRMGAGGGGRAPNHHFRRKLPVLEPLKPRDDKSMMNSHIIQRSPNLAKDDKLESENRDPEDTCGRHFLFDNKCARLERTRTVIPPLSRDYNMHRAGIRPHFGVSKEFSHRHPGQPFTLGFPERYELNPGPAVLLPSTLFLNGRNTLAVENGKLSRPKVNYPSYNLMTVKDNHKSQSYPDPEVGAPRSFIHRISELSSLEAETAREEKLKKRRLQTRKPPS